MCRLRHLVGQRSKPGARAGNATQVQRPTGGREIKALSRAWFQPHATIGLVAKIKLLRCQELIRHPLSEGPPQGNLTLEIDPC